MIRPEVALPPFSPTLVAGILARPLPLAFLQPLLDQAMRTTSSRHSALFERLSDLDNPVFLIDPVDVPFGFELNLDARQPSLRAVRTPGDMRAGPPVATIRGSLVALIALLEGKTDGDALFFSRMLTVEGDTAAVLSLRNAVDSAEIDLKADILSRMGPLAPLAKRAGGLLGRTYERLSRDMALLQDSLLNPAATRIEQQNAKLNRMDRCMQDFQKQLRRKVKRAPVKSEEAA